MGIFVNGVKAKSQFNHIFKSWNLLKFLRFRPNYLYSSSFSKEIQSWGPTPLTHECCWGGCGGSPWPDQPLPEAGVEGVKGLSENPSIFLETLLKLPWNSLETSYKHIWNLPQTPYELFSNKPENHLKLHWNVLAGRHFLRDFLWVCVLYEIFLVRKFMFL